MFRRYGCYSYVYIQCPQRIFHVCVCELPYAKLRVCARMRMCMFYLWIRLTSAYAMSEKYAAGTVSRKIQLKLNNWFSMVLIELIKVWYKWILFTISSL